MRVIKPPQPSKPYQRAYIEISNMCNLTCRFCVKTERAPQTMSVSTFAHIAGQLPDLVEEIFLHVLGEPLLHPDLAAILDICAQKKLPVNIVTNGTLLDEERGMLLTAPIVRQVNLSVHAFMANYGDVDAASYMTQIFKFTRRALQVRPDLYINFRLWDLTDTTVTTDNNKSILQLLMQEFHVDLTTIEIDPKRKKHVPLAQRIFLHFDSRFCWPSLAQPQRATHGYCHALASHFGVLVDGTVIPCCLDENGIIRLGNSTSAPLKEILQAARATRMSGGFARGELIEELCQRCSFISRFDRKARRIRAKAGSCPLKPST